MSQMSASFVIDWLKPMVYIETTIRKILAA